MATEPATGRSGARTPAPDLLATMAGLTVCLLPLLSPAGPGNTAAADAGIAACIAIAGLWTTRAQIPMRFPYLVGVVVLMLGGAVAAYHVSAPASVALVLVQDFFLLLWAAVLALGGRSVAIVSATTHAWCRTAVIYSAVGVLAYIGGITAISGVTDAEGVRASYTFGDPNLAGNYLVISLFMMAACQRPRSPGMRKFGYLVVLTAIVFTGSNGAALSLLVGLVVALTVSAYKRRGALGGIAMLVAVGVVGAVGGVLVLSSVDLTHVRQAAAGSVPLLRDSVGRSNGSSSERKQIVTEGYGLYLKGDALGVGPARTKASFAAHQVPYVKEAHNDYLATLLERGLIGVIGLLALGLSVVVRCSRLLVGRLPEAYAAVVPRPELLIVIGPVMAVAASFYEVLHFRHLWTWLGIVAALSMVARVPTRHPARTDPARMPAEVS